MARDQFDVFPVVGHIDKIATAVVDLLEADATLAAFSPIVRAPVAGIDPEFPKPVMWVTVPEFAAPLQLARELEVVTTVELTMAFEDYRTLLEPTSPTDQGAKTVLTWLTHALTVLGTDAAMHLQVARYSKVSLVDRVLNFVPIDTSFVPPGLRAEVEGEQPILFWVTVGVVYEWKASLDTLRPSAPGV